MTTTTGEQLASDYLARLRSAAMVLPPERRTELLDEIGEYLAAARAAGELGDEAAARTLLDRLGEPEEIVAAARDEGTGPPGGDGTPPWGPPGWYGQPEPPPRPTVTRPPSTALETAAVLMLTLGSLIPILGWLVGVALLWTSRRWRTREKLLGTLVVPGGPGILLLGSGVIGSTCLAGTGTVQYGGPPAGPAPPSLEPAAPPTGDPTPGPPAGPPPPDSVGPPAEQAPPPPGYGFEAVEGCSAPVVPTAVSLALGVVALVGPILVAVFLLRRARARAAAEPPVVRPARLGGESPWGGLEIAAVVLLAVGPFMAPVVGSAVGLVLAWCSTRWSTGEKVVATALALVPTVLLALGFALSFIGVGAL